MLGRVNRSFAVTALCLFLALAAQNQNGPPEYPVKKAVFDKYLTFTGELQARQSVTITTPDVPDLWTFRVSYLVPDGTFVNAGDLIAEFDKSELETKRLDRDKQREEARIAIAQKEAEIDTRRQDLLLNLATAEKALRVSELNAQIDRSLLSTSDYEKYQLENSKAKIEWGKAKERLDTLEKTAKAELDLVRLTFEHADLEFNRLLTEIDRMAIRARQSGMVLCADNFQLDRKVQQGDTIFKRWPLVSIPDMKEVRVIAIVHDKDYPYLEPGLSAEVILDSSAGKTFSAVLDDLPQVATPLRFRSDLRVFRVPFVIREKDTPLFKPGMTARVRVKVARREGFLIPRAAVRVGSRGELTVMKKGGSTSVPVQALDSNDRQLVVSGDLRESDVLLGGSRSTFQQRSQTDWIPVKREDLVFGVSGTGLLEAEKAVDVSPPQIEEIYRFKIVSMVEEGKSVKPGDPILSLDSTEIMKRLTDEQASLDKVKEELEKTTASLDLQGKDLDLQLEEAKVQKEKAENKLTEAREFQSNIKVKEAEYEAELGRKKVQFLERKVSSVKVNSELQLKLLQDKKTFFEKRLKTANDAIESLNIKAPIAGVVIYKANWNNEKKQVGSDVFMLEPVFSIPDLTTLLVSAQVAEVDAGKVKPGQSVTVTLDAIPDKTFTGRVDQISNIFVVASSERPVKVLQLRIRLDALDLKRMRPGMAVRAEIIVDRFKDVLAVPLGVVELIGGKSYVMVQGAKGPERREVHLGKSNGVVAIVESGLAEGEKIAGRPMQEAKTGKTAG